MVGAGEVVGSGALGLRRFLFFLVVEVVVGAVDGGSGSEVWRQESVEVVEGVWEQQEVMIGDVVLVAASRASIWVTGDD